MMSNCNRRFVGGRFDCPPAIRINLTVKFVAIDLSTHFAGFAEKQGTGSSLFGGKSWKKRFFALDGDTLSYFEDEPKGEAVSYIGII